MQVFGINLCGLLKEGLGRRIILVLQGAKAGRAIEDLRHLSLGAFIFGIGHAFRFRPRGQALQPFLSSIAAFFEGCRVPVSGRRTVECGYNRPRPNMVGIFLQNGEGHLLDLGWIFGPLVGRHGLFLRVQPYHTLGILLDKGLHGCGLLRGICSVERADVSVVFGWIFNFLVARLALAACWLALPSVAWLGLAGGARLALVVCWLLVLALASPLRRYCRRHERQHQCDKHLIH